MGRRSGELNLKVEKISMILNSQLIPNKKKSIYLGMIMDDELNEKTHVRFTTVGLHTRV